MLHLALGLTEPYWASMALVVGVRKLHEYEAPRTTGGEARCYPMAGWRLITM